VTMYCKSQPLAVILGNAELFQPPFENYFSVRTGMLWAEYIDTNGASGVEPPAYVYETMADIDAFQGEISGSDASNEIGARLVQSVVDNLLFIGTVRAVSPIYWNNDLKNMPEFLTQSYAYYRTYPYRASQWFLDE